MSATLIWGAVSSKAMMSALGHYRTCAAHPNVRFAPICDRESGLAQKFMSALPPKADMCGATTDVRFGPIADISHLRGRTFPSRARITKNQGKIQEFYKTSAR